VIPDDLVPVVDEAPDIVEYVTTGVLFVSVPRSVSTLKSSGASVGCGGDKNP
jgi:hypothetical protein